MSNAALTLDTGTYGTIITKKLITNEYSSLYKRLIIETIEEIRPLPKISSQDRRTMHPRVRQKMYNGMLSACWVLGDCDCGEMLSAREVFRFSGIDYEFDALEMFTVECLVRSTITKEDVRLASAAKCSSRMHYEVVQFKKRMEDEQS